MFHYMLDAFKSYRSRLDDVHLVQEILEEIPQKLGMKTVMPPFLLPYYNGVVPEDCGISAFVFLNGGHFTIHTFSFRETYFVDLFYPEYFDANQLTAQFRDVFPAEKLMTNFVVRSKPESFPKNISINEQEDFGPHLLIDFADYKEPVQFEQLFELFDRLPPKIDMTPIMRPYIIKNTSGGRKVTSILTMIAESHICLHYFEDVKEAYFDLFSCKFFDTNKVTPTIRNLFKGDILNEVMISRGSKYHVLKNISEATAQKTRSWIDNI